MINKSKWLSSLPINKDNLYGSENQIDVNKWQDTIPVKKKNNIFKKYSFLTVFFITGLLFVSFVKNETRSLQKEINNLNKSIVEINSDLDQAILDHEVLSSPENIEKLAKEHLNIDWKFYEKSQINSLKTKNQDLYFSEKTLVAKKTELQNTNFTTKIKKQITTEINKGKSNIEKIKTLYSNPDEIPDAVKNQVSLNISKKKDEIKKIYNSPKDLLTLDRMRNWGVVQVVKVFLGIPVMPGR